MLKHFTLALMVSVAALHAIAQNLVPNPSFEEYMECPQQMGEIIKATGWQSFRLTPDFFHRCSNGDDTGVPQNLMAENTEPFHGDGYGGFGINFQPSGFSEVMGIALTTPLSIGNTYFVSFYVSRGIPPSSNCASNRVGARFSTRAYSDWPLEVAMPLFNELHVEHSGIVEEAVTWTQVSGYFTADSAYTHLTIGNQFHPDSIQVVCDDVYTNFQAYYLLDAVCVSGSPEDCDVFLSSVQVSKARVILFPNPASTYFFLSGTGEDIIDQVKVYTAHGTLVAEYHNSVKAVQIEVGLPADLSTGIYFIQGCTLSGAPFSTKLLKTY